jgi:hypothetical protein
VGLRIDEMDDRLRLALGKDYRAVYNGEWHGPDTEVSCLATKGRVGSFGAWPRQLTCHAVGVSCMVFSVSPADIASCRLIVTAIMHPFGNSRYSRDVVVAFGERSPEGPAEFVVPSQNRRGQALSKSRAR